jgi:hypothetical protein
VATSSYGKEIYFGVWIVFVSFNTVIKLVYNTLKVYGCIRSYENGNGIGALDPDDPNLSSRMSHSPR